MKNENKSKRYYWIKLKDSFFTSDTIDYLMSQKNGANYVVLYQMLCLKTVNTDGELSRQIGEIVVPFDAEKIQRDCKFFDIDTIRVALELYKNLGLIFVQDNGILRIENFGNMVGSETFGAIEKREQRKQLAQKVDNEIDKGIDNVYQEKENRDKILDNRDIDIYKEKDKKENSNVTRNVTNNVTARSSFKIMFDKVIKDYNFSEKILNSINDWVQYKKEKHQTYKEIGFKKLLSGIQKDINDYGEDYVVDAIDRSIANNWSGIYGSKDFKNEKQSEDKFQKVYDEILKEAREEDERSGFMQIK